MLILAMVISAVIVHAWEESKARSAARWQQAQRAAHERRAAAEERRKAARAARARRVDQARKAGPSDPLWWLWAAGWTVAAGIRGAAAAVAGAHEGAQVGAREGYRLGKEKAFQRRMRQRREAAAFRNGHRAGREDGYEQGKRDHAWAPDPADEVAVEECPRCQAYVPDPATCPCSEAEAETEADSDDGEAIDAEIVEDPPVPDQPNDEEEVVDADVVEDDESTNRSPLAIEGSKPMAITNGISGGDGEGYASAITFAEEVKNGLEQLTGHVTDFGDTLAAKNVDATTSGLVSELYDHLEAAASVAAQLRVHTEAKHGEVAHAIAGAGGSGEVADTDWYDAL